MVPPFYIQMKNFVAIVFIVLSSVKAWSANGDIFTVTTIEGIEMNFKVISESAKTCEVTQPAIPLETEGSVTIPETANGYQVVQIGQNAFENCSNITAVSFPDCLNTIDYDAFSDCSKLSGLVFPENLKTINGSSFNGCSSLTNIFIPKSVSYIGVGVFNGCENIESIVVENGNSLYHSGDGSNCIIQRNWKYVIQGCKNTIIPDDVKGIYGGAFAGHTQLTTIAIPESVVSINNSAFQDCTNLSEITLSGQITTIEDYAFAYCTNLEKVILSGNLTTIGGLAFYECSNLKKVSLPDQLTTIGQWAFLGCNNLTSISIPQSVTEIGDNCFPYSLETMFVKWETPISISQDVINGENTTLFVPVGYRAAYEAAEPWNKFKCIIDDVFMANTVEDVPMFFKIINEEEKRCEVNGNIIRAIPTDYEGEITIPSEIDGYDVVGIGNSAFPECKGITRVSLPDKTEYIGDGAFSKCSNLEYIYDSWNSCLTRIGDYAFNSCSKLSDCSRLTNTGTLEEIGDFAFGFTNIEEAVLSNSLQRLGYAPFVGCENLKRVFCNPGYYSHECGAITDTRTNTLVEYFPFSTSIPAGVKTIGSYAFAGDFLTSFDIPEGVERISENAFYRCESLGSITIPESMKEIDYSSFNLAGVNSVTVKNRKPIKGQISHLRFFPTDYTLYVPKGSKRAYMSMYNWNNYSTVVEYEYNNMDEIDIEMSKLGISTYTSLYNLDFTSITALKAYIASGFNPVTGELLLTRVYDVPGCEGLLLKGDEGTYTVPVNNSDMFYSNLLKGVPVTKTVAPTDGEYTNYILANGDKYGIGFYTLSKEGDIAEGKAYLQIPTSLTSVAEARGIQLRFDDDNSVDAINNINEHKSNQTFFDLQGRRIEQPVKGMYITNGKKIFIK